MTQIFFLVIHLMRIYRFYFFVKTLSFLALASIIIATTTAPDAVADVSPIAALFLDYGSKYYTTLTEAAKSKLVVVHFFDIKSSHS